LLVKLALVVLSYNTYHIKRSNYMKFGRHNKTEEAVVFEGERLPKIIVAQCLGEKCVNWSGAACAAYEDLLQADGESRGTDLPPLRDDASYALYGLACTGGDKEVLVAQRAEILKPGVNMLKIVGLSGMYGDMPLAIQTPQQTVSVETIATSDS
jgi:hypothetical protein